MSHDRPIDPHADRTESDRVLAGSRVLVVDDQFEFLEVIARVLGTAGCSVLTTESAVAAQAMLLQYDFDLLITDIVLGDSNGFALAEWARAVRPDLRLLYISAHHQGDVKLRRARAPLLAKPFRLHDLVSTVERVLVPQTLH